jgi:hypothetical protein
MREVSPGSPRLVADSTADAYSRPEAARLQGWAALLESIYLRAGFEFPSLEQLKPEQVPQPYRTLLVHSADMTPTLEGFYGDSLGLTVLSRTLHEDSYRREVVLTLGDKARPVLYGAIRIFLPALPPKARQAVLQERFPLGHILQTEQIPHLSWPQPFFRVEPDPHMTAMLRLGRAAGLYGRRNVLVDGSRRLLAEVIEVLATAVRPRNEQPRPFDVAQASPPASSRGVPAPRRVERRDAVQTRSRDGCATEAKIKNC